MSGIDMKLNNGNVLIAGVEYKVAECKGLGCDVCDVQYSNSWCRVGGGKCHLKRNQYYKVVDDREMIKANNVYGTLTRYISFKGECENCTFFVKRTGCTMRGLACKGYTPLKPMYKGGV